MDEPLMENNREEDNKKEEMKRKKEKLEREIKELETALEKQDGRLSHLQSNAFQLANYYFVFQGVILTALCNRNTALKCSDRWILASLSVLAASLNLAALVSIGLKYNRMITEQFRTWSKCNELQSKLSNLEEQELQREQVPSRNLSGLSSRESLDAANQGRDDQHPENAAGHVFDYVDKSDIMKRQIFFVICILIFLAFAVVVFVASLKIPCRYKNE